MNNIILLGKPNVGKTSFFLNFAEYLGITNCTLEFVDFQGKRSTKEYDIQVAKNLLISPTAYKTREVCRMQLSIPIYKGKADIMLLDTGGLIDGISGDETIRITMAEALKHLYIANIILHMIDSSSIFSKQISTISEIDYQINQYGALKGAYCILANKIDLKEGMKGLAFLENKFKDTYIIPTSTTKRIGFKEVRKFVSRNI